MKKTKHRTLFLVLIALVVSLAVIALDQRLAETRYTIESKKIGRPVRIIFLSDLHSCVYGDGQAELIAKIDQANPDLIVMSGDMVDDVMLQDGAKLLFDAIAERYPCYYVTGNHEFRSGEAEAVKAMVRGYGISVLEGSCAVAEVDGVTINLCGVDDPDVGEAVFQAQLETAAASADPESFTILLSHRPERLSQYAAYSFDLVLSGHAHGGQFRIPYLLDGLVAPNQGFFPQYTSGLYQRSEIQMLVSRGLAKESIPIPRVFNPPELVLIDLLPASDCPDLP